MQQLIKKLEAFTIESVVEGTELSASQCGKQKRKREERQQERVQGEKKKKRGKKSCGGRGPKQLSR